MKKALILLLCPLLLCSFTSGSRKQNDQSDQDYNRGLEAQKKQDYQGAIEYYKKALNKKPDFSDAWNNLGYSNRMIAKSFLTLAGNAYDKAIENNPNNDNALEYQGEYYLLVGQITDAYANYQKLQAMNSDKAADLKLKLDKVLNEAQEVLVTYQP